MNTILTDDEIADTFKNLLGYFMAPTFDDRKFARAIEAAVLAKLREQEPVAFLHQWKPGAPVIGKRLAWSAHSPHKEVEVTPLYAAPQPAVVQVPQGWKLVPVKPTPEMRKAASAWTDAPTSVYTAMLAAAPEVSSTADRIAELEQQLKAYEAHGVTCQTFRHFVDTPCAECNVRAPEAPAQGVIAWACWPDGQPLTAGNMQLSKDEPTAYTNRVRLIPEAPATAVVQVPQADWAADAREWGSALNDAGWEFDKAYRRHMCEPVSAKLFNTCKTIIRDVILRYAEKVKATAAPEAPALPAVVREALKEAREALEAFKADAHPAYFADSLPRMERVIKTRAKAAAALARLDALGGGE